MIASSVKPSTVISVLLEAFNKLILIYLEILSVDPDNVKDYNKTVYSNETFSSPVKASYLIVVSVP